MRNAYPTLARGVLVAIPVSLSFALFVKGDHRIIYAITFGLLLFHEGLLWLWWRVTNWLEARRAKR